LNNYRSKFNELVKAKTPSMSDLKNRGGKPNHQAVRAHKLRLLLTAKNDDEKQVINRITSCIKFMHQNYDIEAYRLGKLYQTIIKEFRGKTEPTHVPEDIFVKVASPGLKLPQLMNTRLYDKLKACIVDDQPATDGTQAMFSLKNFKLLVDLYQFLPSKKNANGELNTFAGVAQAPGGRNINSSATGAFNTISNPLEDLHR